MVKTFSLVTLILFLWGCAPAKDSSKTPEKVRTVRTVSVKMVPLEDRIEVSGLLVSEKEARLSFKTGGMVQWIGVKEGDSVGEGQLLASLNLTEIRAQADQARENWAKADRDLGRISELYQESVATKEQLDNAASAQALAKNGWEIARYNLSLSEIRAPRSGVIIRKMVNEGEMVASGSPVFFFAGQGKEDWTLQCGLSDKNWVRVHPGDPAEVTFDAFPHQIFSGKVARLSRGADPATGLYQIDIQLAPGHANFATGLFGQGQVKLPASGVGMRIPTEALVNGQGQRAQVFIDENGKARAAEVTVLSLGSDQAVITGGLTDGTQIIVEGAAWVAAGSPVVSVRQE